MVIAKKRAWLAAAALALVCAGLAGGLMWWRSRALATPAALVARVPSRDAVVLYIDFAALRRAGLLQLLAGSQMTAEPEYRAFVGKTRFDYAADLDAAAVSFAPSGRYVAARGRFDWDKLRAYAAESRGTCTGGFCRMAGSTPERNISWMPLQKSVLALAVSRDDQAAETMRRPDPDARPMDAPRDAVWLSLPPAALKSGGELPAGTRMFARSLENADSIAFSLGPDGPRFAVRMDVRCRAAADAGTLVEALARATGMVREFIVREHQTPNPRDLSGVLSGGAFRAQGARVFGYWPVERVFFEELFRGGGPS